LSIANLATEDNWRIETAGSLRAAQRVWLSLFRWLAAAQHKSDRRAEGGRITNRLTYE
jgi:hypothetical protein